MGLLLFVFFSIWNVFLAPRTICRKCLEDTELPQQLEIQFGLHFHTADMLSGFHFHGSSPDLSSLVLIVGSVFHNTSFQYTSVCTN